jgi:hypothetical protein
LPQTGQLPELSDYIGETFIEAAMDLHPQHGRLGKVVNELP